MFERVRLALPRGDLLPEHIWQQRHRVIVVVLWLHALGLAAFGILQGVPMPQTLGEAGVVALAALIAGRKQGSRGFRAAVATLGLVTSSAVLVHLSGGYVEAHFHFFVVLGIITLYQSWVPFLLAITYVVVHHGVLGTLDPTAVYNHPDAWANPWKWALIHGAFVFASSAAYLAAWRLTEYQALHDSLTLLPNRALFYDRVDNASSRLARRDSRFAVIMLDLDDFKKINDSLGHGAGDELLSAVGHRLAAAIRSGDTVARLGGDEFAVLLEELPDEKTVTAIAERLLAALEAPLEARGRRIQVEASLGVAVGVRGDCEVDELMRRADVAMYQVKAAGKRGVALFDPRHVRAASEPAVVPMALTGRPS